MAETGLYRRGGVWQSRVMVPKDLRAHFANRTSLRKSLRTEDREQARLRHAEHVAECRRRFAQLKAGADLSALPAPTWNPPISLVDLERRALADIRDRIDGWIEEGVRLALDADLREGFERDPGPLGSTLRALDAESDGLGGSQAGLDGDDEVYPHDPETVSAAVRWFLSPLRLTLLDFPPDMRREVADSARKARHWWIAIRMECLLDSVDQANPGRYRARLRQRLAALGVSGSSEGQRRIAGNGTVRETVGPTVASMLSTWRSKPTKDNKPQSADMIGKMERAVALLLEFAAQRWPDRRVSPDTLHLADFDKHDAEAFRDWLATRSNMRGKTKKDRLHNVKSLFRLGAKGVSGMDTPFRDVEPIRTTDSDKGRGFTLEELKAIFDAPVFQKLDLDFTGLDSGWKSGGAAAYWVPILALYHGARVTELCQLSARDVTLASHEDGGDPIPVIDIANLDDEASEGADESRPGVRKSRKTAAASRRVPIHRAVLALGFLDYVEDMRRAGHSQLFPEIKAPDGRRAGDYFATFFGAFRRSRGVTGSRLGMHAFRHTLRTRIAGIPGAPQDILDYLVGHANDNHIRSNYRHPAETPAAVRRILDQVDYPGLRLPRVYRSRPEATTPRIPHPGDSSRNHRPGRTTRPIATLAAQSTGPLPPASTDPRREISQS